MKLFLSGKESHLQIVCWFGEAGHGWCLLPDKELTYNALVGSEVLSGVRHVTTCE